MKTILYLYLLLFSVAAYAQNEIKTIHIYPYGQTDHVCIPTRLEYGQRLRFEINNVNTFNLSADATSEETNFDFEVPAVLKEADAKDSLTKGNDEQLAKELGFIAKLQNQFLQELSSFRELQSTINERIKLRVFLKEALDDVVLVENIDAFKANLGSYYKAFYTYISDQHEAVQNVSVKIEELENSYSILKRIYGDLSKSQESKPLDLSGSYTNGDNVEIIIKNVSIKPDDGNPLAKEFEAVKKVMEIINDPDKKAEIIRKSYAGIDLHFQVQNATFKAYTDSEQVRADEVTFSPKLLDKEGKVVKEFKPYTFRTNGGVKFNFSTGYLLSFKGNDVYDTYKNEAGETEGVVKTNTDDLTHALGFMGHVYPRGECDMQPGFSVGLSLQDNANIGFYSGISLLFQESNRFVLTGGLAFTKLNMLNTSNLNEPENNRRSFISENDTEIHYDEVYKPSFFVGITFNLNGKNTENEKVDLVIAPAEDD